MLNVWMSLDATSTDSEKFKSQHEVYSNPKFDIDPSFLVVPGWMVFGSLPENLESPMWLFRVLTVRLSGFDFPGFMCFGVCMLVMFFMIWPGTIF